MSASDLRRPPILIMRPCRSALPALALSLAAAGLLSTAGCKRAADPKDRPVLAAAPRPMVASAATLRERSGPGRIRFLGVDLDPAKPERGQEVRVTSYFQVEVAPTGDYDVFVHGEAPGGARVIVADHAPAEGRFLTSRWKAGEIWRDQDRIAIPKDAPAGTIELFMGLFKGDVRLTVEAPPGGSDGQDRIRAGVLTLAGDGPKDDLPTAVVHRATGKLTPDGVLDEADWAKAEVLTFSDSMGRGAETRWPTKLRLLWDAENLYVAFEASDEDITERFSQRDDPIYDHEAVEVFLMPKVRAPDLGPYVELQASPGGVIFDASFTGRRQGMDKTFNAATIVGTKLDGTLNVSTDGDKGWVSEWVVPWKSVRWVESPPAEGDEWRMNAFRIEKNAKDKNGEYTAWSPPKVGDFHNVVRFGRMQFQP